MPVYQGCCDDCNISYPSAAALATDRIFVDVNSSEQIAATTAGAGAIGVLEAAVSATGDLATARTGGILLVRAGGTVTAGGNVSADANGKAVDSTYGALVLGKALTGTSTADTLVRVIMYPKPHQYYGSQGVQEKVAVKALAGATIQGGVQAWQNPESTSIVITGVYANVTTAATGAATMDIGTTATNATTASDNLIDGQDVNAAAGCFASGTGTNGKISQPLASGKWVTIKSASGDTTGLVGNLYIKYIVL